MTINKPPDKTQKGNQIIGQMVALGMGGLVAVINSGHGHGLEPSMTAGVKQYAYSATIALMLIEAQRRIYNYLRQRYEHTLALHATTILAPAFATVLFTYLLHSAKGTPETLASTLPTLLVSPVGYTILHSRRILAEIRETIASTQFDFNVF